MSSKRKAPAAGLVPVVFAHMCCGGGFVFGQGPNGDNYKRRADAPGSEEWEPVVPALGPATNDRSIGVETKAPRAKRTKNRRA